MKERRDFLPGFEGMAHVDNEGYWNAKQRREEWESSGEAERIRKETSSEKICTGKNEDREMGDD